MGDLSCSELKAFPHAVRVATGEQAIFFGYEMVTPPVHYPVVGILDASSGASRWDWRGPERPIPVTGALSLQAAQEGVWDKHPHCEQDRMLTKAIS